MIGKAQVLRLCAVLSLLAGLACGVTLYLRAPEDAGGVGYVIEGGQVYAVRPEDSRSYQRGLEYMGGKSAVLAEELSGRIAGLWSGGGAALCVAGLGVIGCALFWRAADRAADAARRCGAISTLRSIARCCLTSAAAAGRARPLRWLRIPPGI